ncbi:hypothetical protein [Actinokineospora globicatena]|uniref:Uncharacterized protein n=1 Tax=Actinokineospora globicatena TaxID=103729 RepID=A0A9W6QLI1_9PSEU|nr:hypothetical protein [Actinokineospora globicatena]GLW91797.1 hypothetical protein Aglo03_26130 [Actinokineospora globicatena]
MPDTPIQRGTARRLGIHPPTRPGHRHGIWHDEILYFGGRGAGKTARLLDVTPNRWVLEPNDFVPLGDPHGRGFLEWSPVPKTNLTTPTMHAVLRARGAGRPVAVIVDTDQQADVLRRKLAAVGLSHHPNDVHRLTRWEAVHGLDNLLVLIGPVDPLRFATIDRYQIERALVSRRHERVGLTADEVN